MDGNQSFEWSEGYNAYYNGVSIMSNPYLDSRFKQWNLGWKRAYDCRNSQIDIVRF